MNSPNKTFAIAHPPGVGDIYWCALLMEDFKRQNGIHHLTASIHRDGGHPQAEEGARLFSVYDSIVAGSHQTWEYSKPLKNRLWNIRNGGDGVDLKFEMNTPLEKGIRLEHATKYKPNWNLKLNIGSKDRTQAYKLLSQAGVAESYVVFYIADLRCNRNWNKDTWKKGYWGILAGMFRNHGWGVVIIGSEKDEIYAQSIQSASREKMPSLCGKTSLAEVSWIIKKAKAVIAFPSGMGILSVHQKVPTVMFWSIQGISPNGNFLPGFMTSWVRPDMLSGKYMPIPYGSSECNPESVFDFCVGKKNEKRTVS